MNQENCISISSEKNWVEQAAKDQLCDVGRLPGIIKAAGLPNLHPGKIPVGMAVFSQGRFYPHLTGNDTGYGMSLFQSEVRQKKFRMNKWVTRLNPIRELGDTPCDIPYEEKCPSRDFGAIGIGNHFVEFQCLDQVHDETVVGKLGLMDGKVLLLIHSSSRGYGQDIPSHFYSPEGLEDGTPEAEAYLAEYNNALLWAEHNRLAAAAKFLDYLGVDSQVKLLTDSCHNYVEQTKEGWLHRKGSVSAGHRVMVTPSSRGSLTYVRVSGKDTGLSLNFLSHGTGRKWTRGICKSRINRMYNRNSIRSIEYKSQVVRHDTDLLFAEASEAYKNVEQAIGSLQGYGLTHVAATLRPLITLKGQVRV